MHRVNSSYYSWACSSAVFTWKRGIWVIVLRRKCLCIKYSNVSAIFRTSDSFYRRWGIAQPMDAPTEVIGWDWRTYRGINIALSIAIWRGQAPLNIWTCSSLEKYVFGGMFTRTICLSSLLSLLIMTQMPHFHALSHRNRWTAGSTVITAINPLFTCNICCEWRNSWTKNWLMTKRVTCDPQYYLACQRLFFFFPYYFSLVIEHSLATALNIANSLTVVLSSNSCSFSGSNEILGNKVLHMSRSPFHSLLWSFLDKVCKISPMSNGSFLQFYQKMDSVKSHQF